MIDDLADLHADLVGGHRRLGAPSHRRSNACEARFGGGQEFVTRPGTVRGQGRVVTHHEPFAGIVSAGDLGEVRRIEERGLERAVLGERANGRKAQRGNPAHSGMPAQRVDLRVCQHTPVADQHHALQPKPRAQLLDLVRDGRGVARVAWIHVDRDGPPRAIGQQAVDNAR